MWGSAKARLARCSCATSRSHYPCLTLCLASFEIAMWIPTLAIWMLKPWLDRTVLFALSRAAFGQATTPADLWAATASGVVVATAAHLDAASLVALASLTGPAYQLEGLSGGRLRKRVRQVRLARAVLRNVGDGCLQSGGDLPVLFALLSLFGWFAPEGMQIDFTQIFDPDWQRELQFVIALGYAAAVAIVEPFYVAAGFGMYLNRRVELEAWDIEQEFRRAQP